MKLLYTLISIAFFHIESVSFQQAFSVFSSVCSVEKRLKRTPLQLLNFDLG